MKSRVSLICSVISLDLKLKADHFWPKFLLTFDYKSRKEITQKVIESGEMDQKYSLVTMSMNGTHRLMQLQSMFSSDSQYSWKLKDIAYNMLVIIFW